MNSSVGFHEGTFVEVNDRVVRFGRRVAGFVSRSCSTGPLWWNDAAMFLGHCRGRPTSPRSSWLELIDYLIFCGPIWGRPRFGPGRIAAFASFMQRL